MGITLGVRMKLVGNIVAGLGAVVLFWAMFVYDTAPDGTHNIGLLQQQLMWFQTGGIGIIAGVLISLIGRVFERLEQAGLIPDEIVDIKSHTDLN